MLHQVLDAVLFGSDRVFFRFLPNLDLRNEDLISSDSLIGRLDLAGDGKDGFLRQLICRIISSLIDRVLHYNALAKASTVAQDKKADLSARPLIIEPTPQRYFLVD